MLEVKLFRNTFCEPGTAIVYMMHQQPLHHEEHEQLTARAAKASFPAPTSAQPLSIKEVSIQFIQR